jgi:hypothetical protein
MRDEVLKDLLAKLEECTTADANARAEFRRMIEAVRARHGIGRPARDERTQFARQLLDARTPRPEVRDRLMARFQVGESQAYRDIADALQIVPKTS